MNNGNIKETSEFIISFAYKVLNEVNFIDKYLFCCFFIHFIERYIAVHEIPFVRKQYIGHYKGWSFLPQFTFDYNLQKTFKQEISVLESICNLLT